ncbi:hypothetical protein AB4Z46_28210 [Variovorax sp. M-6]|uniref:hypothetical protein n=1 Tax=Variovorax sp. M-6 TaxID=3233041 RepID=UPI003F957258
MSIDSQNFEVASNEPVWRQPGPHFELHVEIRKALRAQMTETLHLLGRIHDKDDVEVAQTCQCVQDLLVPYAACAETAISLYRQMSIFIANYELCVHDAAERSCLGRTAFTTPIPAFDLI